MSGIKPSALQLVKYWIPDVSCSANAQHDPEKPFTFDEKLFRVEVITEKLEKVESDDETERWVVQLSVSQQAGSDNYPYLFDITTYGTFISEFKQLPEERRERFVRINGSSVLYGALRDFLRSITATGPWGPLLLPMVSFTEVPKDEKQPELLAAKQ